MAIGRVIQPKAHLGRVPFRSPSNELIRDLEGLAPYGRR